MTPKIFISYRRLDSQDFTDRLFDYMAKHFGVANVFQDVGDSTKIPPGVDFVDYLAEQVSGCDVVLVVIGEQWTRILHERASRDDDFVRIEVESALQQGKIVIPVLKSATPMPASSEMPESIRKLARLNASRVRPNPDFVRDCETLADGIKAVLDKKAFATTPVAQAAAPAPAAPPPALKAAKPTSLSLLPAPFAWIEIPKKSYSIAKYPVTNAQFAKFIEARGYNRQEWWTAAGWEQRQKDKWTEPRYWTNGKWNGAEQPVVGVSWYEAVAFCLWLSDVTGEQIMLPTEDQWQYAALGDAGKGYPWGNDWDCKRCNNSVTPCDSNVTTHVTQYAGKGDSSFGVVDMAGNVWEWCLTDYERRTNDINNVATNRVLRGGSWNYDNTDGFRCDDRGESNPHGRGNNVGFRVSLS
jgi:formylglycine-generating enzyme required for sulfatase activity